MFKSTSLLAPLAVLVIASLACSSSGVSTPDSNYINTSVAQTLIAIQSQSTQPAIPVNLLDTVTPTITSIPPILTPTATLSPTSVFTVTPLVPQISVSVPTNCRVGPGKVYDRVGALLVGETTEIVGRNPVGNYWYVRNPDPGQEFCWLWGEYATLVGNTQTLPIYTPPPTPTPVPNFEASYAGLDSCVGWWVEIKLVNNGGIDFRSMSLRVIDRDTDTVVSVGTDMFANLNGCNNSDSRKALASGEKFVVSSPIFNYDPTDHKMRATITLCSDDGVNGTCLTKVVEFKP
ncbi:MAG TPA: SH3 domain-containing protein [Anaerolineales bacterium]|nr:SH3 domain-containing protein [Anaerolineales bacterium]